MLQREHQRHCQSKRKIDKENIDPNPKKRRNDAEIPKARIYSWISYGLDRHTLGNMDCTCYNCGALMWLDERVNVSAKSPIFTTCCAKGKVFLPPLQNLPPPLDRLLTGMDQNSRLF